MRPSGVCVRKHIASAAMQRPGHDQIIDLDAGRIFEAEQAVVDHAVGVDAALAAEEMMEHQRRGRHQFADAERDHGKRGGALLGRHVAEHDRQRRGPTSPASSGISSIGTGRLPSPATLRKWMVA